MSTSARVGTSRFARRSAALLFVLGVGLGAAAWAYARWAARPVLLDDAFISFRYAYNLVHGQGLVYNAGERVEGYTNFLWVLLAAAAIRLRLDPIAVTRAVGVLSYAVAAFGVAAVAAGARGLSVPRRIPAVALAALMVLPTGLASFAGTGLETSFLGLVILAVGVTGLLLPPSRWSLGAAGLLCLAALLTRMDTALAVAAYAAVAVRQRGEGAPLPGRLLRRFAVPGLGFAAYLGWKWLYYRSFVPNTYYAKAADVPRFDAGSAYVLRFVQSYPSAVVLLLLAMVAAASPERRRAAFARFALLALGLHGIYVAKVGGDFMEYRMLWEYWPLLCMAAVLGAQTLAESHAGTAAGASLLAVLLTASPTILESSNYMQSLDEMNGYADLAREVGSGLGRALPTGTVVATTLAGAAYFMPDVTVIDQWGLNDAYVGHQVVDNVRGRGHIKFAPDAYLRQRRVNLYIEHPVVCACDSPCVETKPNVFIRLGETNRCLRTWYFTPAPALTRLFCAQPRRFELANVPCPPGEGEQSSDRAVREHSSSAPFR